MGNYRTWLKTQGPDWLRATNGQALSGEIGRELDLQQDRLTQGLLARFPLKGNVDADGRYGIAPDDALAQIGEDRGMRQGEGESAADYAQRLYDAWAFRVYAGSHWGVLQSLRLAGYVDPIIVQDNGRWARLTGSAGTVDDLALGDLMDCIDRGFPGWTFDTRKDFYARFAIVFEADDPGRLDEASGQAILNDIVRKWQPSNKRYDGAIVILTGSVWGWPTGQEWGDVSDKWGGDSARYIPGDGSDAYEVP